MSTEQEILKAEKTLRRNAKQRSNYRLSQDFCRLSLPLFSINQILILLTFSPITDCRSRPFTMGW